MKKRLIGALFIVLSIFLIAIPFARSYYYRKLRERNLSQSSIEIISSESLNNRIQDNDSDLMIIDVRSDAEYENGHIPTSIHIPIVSLEDDAKLLDKSKDYVLFCGALTCGASDTAARKLHDLGFYSLFVLEGGYSSWENGGYQVETGACPFHSGLDEESFWEECLDVGIVVGAGLTDGFNPCAIGMMLFLLGYLIIFAESGEKVLPIGITYVSTVFTTYFIVGMLLYGAVNSFISNPVYVQVSEILKVIISELLIIVGLINIADYLFPKGTKFTLGIPDATQPILKKLATRASIPATVLLGILVTLFETPCSLPIYVGTLELLGRRLNLGWKVFGLIGLYNFLFILPLIVILLLIVKGVGMIKLKEWEHQNRGLMKLSMGIGIIVISVIMLFI